MANPCFVFKGAWGGRGDKVGDALDCRPTLEFVPELHIFPRFGMPILPQVIAGFGDPDIFVGEAANIIINQHGAGVWMGRHGEVGV